MRRRDFLSLLLLSPATVWAEDGLLIDVGTTGVAGSGLLCDSSSENVSGMLLDIPKEVVKTQRRKLVYMYSPATWTCSHCNTAEKALKEHPGIELKVVKNDSLEGFFSGKSFPILHWAAGIEGEGWQSGWTGKEQFLAKVFKDESQPPSKKPLAEQPQTTPYQIQDRGGSHWSVEGDWSPSRQKTINHLVNVHGYERARVENLNLGQLLTLHDYAHEGHKVQSQRVGSRSCPTGNCPTQSNGSFLFWRW